VIRDTIILVLMDRNAAKHTLVKVFNKFARNFRSKK
jgi:hypothetical protein